MRIRQNRLARRSLSADAGKDPCRPHHKGGWNWQPADDIAALLAGCIEASGLKVCYYDARDFAPSQRYGTMSEMCDSMAELIAHDLPDTDDLEVFAAAMEAHPLDPYREAFADACHHNGRDDLRKVC